VSNIYSQALKFTTPGGLSTTESENDGQSPNFDHKIILDGVLPGIKIEPIGGDDIKMLKDRNQHAAELHEREVLADAASRASGKWYEGGRIEDNLVCGSRSPRWVVSEGAREPTVGPECVWERIEIPWVALEGVCVHESLRAFREEAVFGVNESWKPGLDIPYCGPTYVPPDPSCPDLCAPLRTGGNSLRDSLLDHRFYVA
jgi:hypothetical protein